MDEAWKNFMETGRVSAYLQYKNAETERMKLRSADNSQEEKPDGTEYRSDRNGLTGYADWRL